MSATRPATLILACLFFLGCATADQKLLSFQAEPTSPEEQAVAQRMESSMKAYNARQFDLHGEHYAPDARIYSLIANGMVNRGQYLAAVKTSSSTPVVSLTQAKITMLETDRSRVTGILNFSGTARPSSRPVIYDFTKRNGEWFIVEQKF